MRGRRRGQEMPDRDPRCCRGGHDPESAQARGWHRIGSLSHWSAGRRGGPPRQDRRADGWATPVAERGDGQPSRCRRRQGSASVWGAGCGPPRGRRAAVGRSWYEPVRQAAEERRVGGPAQSPRGRAPGLPGADRRRGHAERLRHLLFGESPCQAQPGALGGVGQRGLSVAAARVGGHGLPGREIDRHDRMTT